MPKDNWTDDMIPDDFSGGDLAYLESYKEMDVDVTLVNIGVDATNLVTSLCNMYLKNHLINEDDYIAAVAAVEITQLSSAMLAVRSVEHALKTLMRQLDAGGYANSDIFDQINTLAKTSLDLTMKTTQYLRTLPEFLKFTANEMRENGLLRSVEIIQDGAYAKANEQVEEASYDLSGPIMGTKNLMLQIRDAETDLDAVIEAARKTQKQTEADNLREPEVDKAFVKDVLDDE